MQLAEAMRRDLACCRTDETLHAAAKLMWERNTGTVLVIDAEGVLAGIVTDRDVAMAAYTQGRPLTDMPVGVAMARNVATCRAHEGATEAQRAMREQRARRVPVVDEEGRPIGIVSVDDLAREAIARGADEREAPSGFDVLATLVDVSTAAAPGTAPPLTDARARLTVPGAGRRFRHSMGALRRLRDEVRVDLNLASKEVRDRVHELDRRFHVGPRLTALGDALERLRPRKPAAEEPGKGAPGQS